MKVLYLPIFEPGDNHAAAVQHKRGLYDALCKAGHEVYEYDYLEHRAVIYPEMEQLLTAFQSDLVLSQFHGADVLTPEQIASLRAQHPAMQWVNWSGDSWLHSLISHEMLALIRQFDLQLVAAPDVLPVYETHGIKARYWNIAYEPPLLPLPDMPTYEVVFLGNTITAERRLMMEMLRRTYNVGIYGDWEQSDGRNTYHFAAGEALYKNAKLAIADNVYPDQQNYISNRPMQIMAAGGAVCLHQHVPKMIELSGWVAGVHYVEWTDRRDLQYKIGLWLDPKLAHARREMADCAQAHVLTHHTWDARVKQLFEEYL